MGYDTALLRSSAAGGVYTFATLPSAAQMTGYGDGVQAYTSDQGLCVWNGTAWTAIFGANQAQAALAARRAQNIANYLVGPQIPAPAWASSTSYTNGAVVSLSSGQHMECVVSGTSGASAPVYSSTVLTGRPLIDNTVTWYGLPIVATSTATGAPTITSGTSAAALGLTETQFITSGTLNPKVTCFSGFVAASNGPQAYGFASGNNLSSNNCSSLAVAAGYSAGNSYYIFEYDLEFYVTDCFFGITMKNVTNQLNIEVDGVLVAANAVPGSGSSGFCIAFNYNGVVKRRLVRIMCNTNNVLVQGVALSTIGFWEASDTPNDVIATVGDSINMTITPSVSNSIAHLYQGYLKRYLGVAGMFNLTGAGAGYYNANANTYNALAMLQNAANQQMLALQKPGHVIFDMGINDIGQPQANVLANALASWQLARQLLPSAKITVTDGFSQAGGPSAAQLTQAAALLAQWNAWGDGNSRFIQVTSAAAATAWVQGTANASGSLAAGNSCDMVSTDGIHPTPIGADYLAKRMAYALQQAWNNNY